LNKKTKKTNKHICCLPMSTKKKDNCQKMIFQKCKRERETNIYLYIFLFIEKNTKEEKKNKQTKKNGQCSRNSITAHNRIVFVECIYKCVRVFFFRF